MPELVALKQEIAALWAQREALKASLEVNARAPGDRRALLNRLEQVDQSLSILDTRYKRLWDARSGRG